MLNHSINNVLVTQLLESVLRCTKLRSFFLQLRSEEMLMDNLCTTSRLCYSSSSCMDLPCCIAFLDEMSQKLCKSRYLVRG